MAKKIKQLFKKISELFYGLLEHVIIIILFALAMRLLLEIGMIFLPGPNQWSELFIFLSKIWFLIIFFIYIVQDIRNHFRRKKNKKE